MKKYDLTSLEKLPIDIYADGSTIDQIKGFDKGIIKGYTFNPTLFKNLKVTDYLGFCRKLLKVCGDAPVSLEVIADDPENMVRQAAILRNLGKNVFVKIPVTFTSGETTIKVIETLIMDGFDLNITAVFTKKQVEQILTVTKESHTIISVFSGRIFDIGIDAVKVTGEIADLVHEKSNCRIIWASPRMVFDIINACEANCDIITMQPSLIGKLSLFKKTPEEYSLETVQMFHGDAVASGYKL